MSEKYDFSISEDREKFEQLPHEEKEAIIGDAQDEAAEIQRGVQKFVGKSEKLNVEHYQLLSERLDREAQELRLFIENIESINPKEIQDCIDPKERIAKEIEAQDKATVYFYKLKKLKLIFKEKSYSDYAKNKVYKEFVFRMINNGWAAFMDEKWCKLFSDKDQEDIYLKLLEVNEGGGLFNLGYFIDKWNLRNLSFKVVQKLIQINDASKVSLVYPSHITDYIVDNIDSFADKNTALFLP